MADWKKEAKKSLERIGYYDYVRAKNDAYAEQMKKEKETAEVAETAGITPASQLTTGAKKLDELRRGLLINRLRPRRVSFARKDTYDYLKTREEALRPILNDISNDADRSDSVFREWAKNYSENPNWTQNKNLLNQSKNYYEKFKAQDSIIEEYDKIVDILEKLENNRGIKYTESGEIDFDTGSRVAKEAKERHRISSDAKNTFSMDDYSALIFGDATDETKTLHEDMRKSFGQSEIEGTKEKAYIDYGKNKDNSYNDSLWGRFTGNRDVGRFGIKQNNADFKSFQFESDDIVAGDIYDELIKRIQNRNTKTFLNDSSFEKNLATIAQYIPQAEDQYTTQALGRIFGSALGVFSGSPLGIKSSGDLGSEIASARYMYRQTAGSAFGRLLRESGLTAEDAKRLAHNEALASSSVEFGLEFVADKIFNKIGGSPMVKQISKNSAQTIKKAMIAKGISEAGADLVINSAKKAGKFAVESMGEGVEEWIQEGMSITTDRLAKEGKKANVFDIYAETFDFSKYSDDDLNRMDQNFFAGMLLGFVGGGTKQAIDVAAPKVVSAISNISNIIDTNRLGKAALSESANKDILTEAIEKAKESPSDKVANALFKVENAITEGKMPPYSATGILVKNMVDSKIKPQTVLSEHTTDMLIRNKNKINMANLGADVHKLSGSMLNERIIRAAETGLNSLGNVAATRLAQAAGMKAPTAKMTELVGEVTKNMAVSERGIADIDTVRAYAQAYVEGLKSEMKSVYSEIDSRTDNVAEAIVEATLGIDGGHITETLKNHALFDRTVNNFKKSFSQIMLANSRFRNDFGFSGTDADMAYRQFSAISGGDYSSVVSGVDALINPVENITEPANAYDDAVATVRSILESGKITSAQADMILLTPALRDAFVRLTGQKIEGTKAEQRAIVENYRNEVSVAEQKAVSEDIAEIEVAIEETLKNGAEDAIFRAMESEGKKGDLTLFAERLKEKYAKTGSIGALSNFFADGGKRVIAVMEGDNQNAKTQGIKNRVKTIKNSFTEYAEDEARLKELEGKIKDVSQKIENLPEEDMRKINGRAAIREYEEEIEDIRAIRETEKKIKESGRAKKSDDLNAENNTQDDTSSVGKADTFPSRGRLVEQTEYGYELRGLPDANALSEIANSAVEGAVVTLKGNDAVSDATLIYDEGVSADAVKADIIQYYRDGIMPDAAYEDDLPWDDVKFSSSEKSTDSVLPSKKVNDIINENEISGEVNNNELIREYDDIREVSGEVNAERRLLGQTNQGRDTESTQDTAGRMGRDYPNDSRKDGSEKTDKGRIKGVYHGSKYQFNSFEKSYVDIGIHFGTKEQAEARIDGEEGSVSEYDLILKNPLSCEDIFGERTPDEYVEDIIESSALKDYEKAELREGYESYKQGDIERGAKEALKEKIASGKYNIETEIDDDGIFVNISLKDDVGNTNQIPLTELIDREILIEMFGEDVVSSMVNNAEISNFAKIKLSDLVTKKAVQIEANFLKLRKIEDILKSFGYDGFVYENQNEGEGLSYAVFDVNQIINRTDKSSIEESDDIRFSFSNDVEETKDLIAVHNLSAEKLLKALNLGGFPMPSIAITRAEEGYPNFGDISVVFGKDTINPEGDLANKVYSGDAWTPTYPRLEYKANEDKIKEINNLYYEVMRKFGSNDAYPLYSYAYTDMAEEKLDRKGGENAVISELKEDTDLMQTFFLINGEEKVAPIEKEIVTKISDSEKEQYDYLISKVGKDFFEKSKTPEGTSPLGFARKYFKENGSVLENAFKDMLSDVYGFNQNEQSNVLKQQNEFTYVQLIRKIRGYIENGDTTVRTEVDNSATKEAIRKKAEKLNFNEWVEKTFKGIAEKQGIANQKDPYTPSGNRRSFDELHYEYNLENVVRAMMESGEKGIGGFGGGNVFGAATENYNSINDIKQNAKKRMNNIPESKFEEMREEFRDRLFDIARLAAKNEETSTFAITDVFTEAIAKHKTRDSIARYLESELEGWANYSDDITDKLIQLVSEIREMPASYFEAKPQRAVGFDEVKAVIMPAQYSYEEDLSELKTMLDEMNVPVIEYEYGDNESRRKALNSVEDVRFSNDNTLESEVNEDEQGRNGILSGDVEGRLGESAGEQGGRILKGSGASEENGRKGQGTARSRRLYGETVRKNGGTEVKRRGFLQCEFVKEEYYSYDMKRIAAENSKKGITTHFFVGDGKHILKKALSFRGAVKGDEIFIQCDNAKYSAEQINKHEIVHREYKSGAIQKIKAYIESKLTKEEKKNISEKLYANYRSVTNGNVDAIFEEFVCDVMAGMNDYGVRFENIANEYWSNQESDIDIYSPAEYTESIDAGGNEKQADGGKGYSFAGEGDVENEKTRDNRKRTERLPERVGNQRSGDSGYIEDISNGNPKSEVQSSGGNLDRKGQTIIKGSRAGSVVGVAPTSDTEISPGRTRANGERFLVALREGDIETARALLNEQAVKSGFVPAHMYHGTLSDEVFTQFESEVGIYWVTPSLKYAENYTDGYYGDDIKAEQLFTKPDSGVYDLYIKPGKVLDVGNINVDINIDVIDDFRSRIGFSNEEFNICWGESRKHEYNQLWTIVNTPSFAKIAREHGYDALRATERDGIQTYGCLYPEDLKSAKLETFDDNGQLIPFEERFDTSTNDIRYSFTEDESTDYLAEPLKQIKDDINEVRLRAELRKGKVYSRDDVRQVAASILNNIDVGTGRGMSMSNGDKATLLVLTNRVLNATPTSQGNHIKRMAAFIAQKAKVFDSLDTYDYASDLKELKANIVHSMSLTASDKATLDSVGASGYKSLFGGGKSGVDVIYADLSSQRPDMFPMDTNATDTKLLRIVEMYDFLKNGVSDTSESLIDILNAEDRRAFVDVINKELDAAFNDTTVGRDSKVVEEVNKVKARLKKTYEKKLFAKRETTALKTSIRNIVSNMRKNLQKNEKTGGYPKEIVKAAAEVLSAIDMHTNRTAPDGTPTKTSLKLDALKTEYDELKNNKVFDFQSEYSEELSEKIGALRNLLKDRQVIGLDVYELSELKDILSEISHRLSIARKQIGLEKKKENAEIASEIINDIKRNNVSNNVHKKQWLRELKSAAKDVKAFILNPHRVNEVIAGYDKNSEWWKLYDAINRGSRKAAKFVMDANKPFDALIDGDKNEIAFYDFRTKTFKTGIKYTDGSEVEIPKSIMCELIMAWKRDAGRKHLEVGGATIPDIKLYNKGMTSKAIDEFGKVTMPITQKDIDRLNGMLDEYDKKWIDKAHYLFDNTTKDAINETSMQLLGRELAKVKNYIRLYVDTDFVNREIADGEYSPTLEGHGSLKETVKNAAQPILLRGLHENVYDQIDFVSKYYGLAIPIRNFNKVYASRLGIGDNAVSVRKAIGNAFGPQIRKNVVEQLILDLQTTRKSKGDIISQGYEKIRGAWLTATFWGNIRSTLKQTTSYWTASAILGEDSLVVGLAKYARSPKKTKSEIGKYSGTLYKRSQGLSTTELGDRANAKRLAGASKSLTKFINKYAPVLRKIPQGIRPGNWLQTMDVTVSAALWEACKVEVAKTIKKSDGRYMSAVADLYERVIEETQSNYDVIHRPEALKTTNPITRTVTMFQTDNLQQTGIIYGALGDYKAKSALYKNEKSDLNKKALSEAQKRLSKAVRSRIYSSVWIVFTTILGNMLLRKFKPYIDDEEKEITSKSVLEQAMLQISEDMIGVLFPVVGDLTTKFMDTFSNGYDFVSDPSFDAIQELIESTSKIWKCVAEGEDIKDALVDAIPAISNFTGIPLKNIYDLFKSVEGYAGDIAEGEFVHDITDYGSSKSFYSYADLASCIIDGDKEKEDKILDYYSEKGRTVSKATLTKTIKPIYLDLRKTSPQKAKAVKSKLIKDYGYSSDTIDNWTTTKKEEKKD